MSRIGEEWVSAPTLRKSTPVRGVVARHRERQATGRLDLDVLPGAPHRLHRLAQQRHRHVVAEQEPRPGRDRLQRLGGGGDLDLDVDARGRWRGPRRTPRVSEPGGELVVVLDHRDVVQAHALVGAAAAAHGVLLQGAQPRRGLAGVEDHRAGALEGVGPAAGVRGDAGEPAEQVQQGALADQRWRRVEPRRTASTSPAAHHVAVLAARLDVDLGRPEPLGHRPEHGGQQRHPGHHPVLAGDHVGGAALGGGDGGAGGDVDAGEAAEVLVQGGLDDRGGDRLGKEVQGWLGHGVLSGSGRWAGASSRSPAAGATGVYDVATVAAGAAAGPEVAAEAGVVAVGEVGADVAAAGLLAAGRDLGQQLADVQQVGGLPGPGPGSRSRRRRRRLRRSASAAMPASADAVAARDAAERTAPAPAVIARWISVRRPGVDEGGRPLGAAAPSWAAARRRPAGR